MLRLVPHLLAACLIASGCTTLDVADESATAHDNVDAIVWLQTSTEYAAAASSMYAAATTALQELANKDSADTSGMAVVLDVDETVLDNSRYQAQLVFDQATYNSETWDDWIELRAAPAVPGVVEFVRTAQSLGVHVAFITNRACRTRPGSPEVCPQKTDTLANLADVGIDTQSVSLFLRGERPEGPCSARLTEAEQASGTWSSDKTSRRECVRLDREIVMLFGDQLGDFTNEHDDSDTQHGRSTAADYSDRWGRSWFMLPNPTYGDWKPSTFPEKQTRIRGLR